MSTIYEVFNAILRDRVANDSAQERYPGDDLVTTGDYLLALEHQVNEAKREWTDNDSGDNTRAYLLVIASTAVRGLRDLGLPEGVEEED